MTHKNTYELSRQRFLDRIHGYLHGRVVPYCFRTNLSCAWGEVRQTVWREVYKETSAQRCEERERLVLGASAQAKPDDPRRFCRMLDRLSALCLTGGDEEEFRPAVQELLTAYRRVDSGNVHPTEGEARFVAYPPKLPVFERPLPSGGKHHYPCSIQDIRRQLTLLPEYDLEGIWAIGLYPTCREYGNAYATYFRRYYPMRKPVILIYSWNGAFEFKLKRRDDPGYIERKMSVEREYGMQIERRMNGTYGYWHEDDIRRYTVEHVLLHEIGHHVQYQQRWRAQCIYRLPSHQKEQFAEDYAIRSNRQPTQGEYRDRR